MTATNGESAKGRPTSIRRSPERTLDITWSNGEVCHVDLQFLRKECPCAHCKGENILGKVYKPLVLPTYVEGMNNLVGIEPVGSYAIRLSWGDGHTTGIYSWEYLDLLCAESAKQKDVRKGEEN